MFTVDSADDNVATVGSLRWAIAQANADGAAPTIDIAAGLEIDLTCGGGGALAYDNPASLPLTINGNGAVIRQTCAATPVMTADDDITLNRMIVTGGTDGGIIAEGDVTGEDLVIEGNTGGAGIEAFTGRITLTTSTVRGNTGTIGGGVAGIHVVATRSTFSGNQASTGAGIWADQTATLTNSTVTQNIATGAGGGILATNSFVDLTHVTIVQNTAASGANVAILGDSPLQSFASVLAFPQGATNCAVDSGASDGHNFDTDGSCGLEAGAGDPQLGALGDNGGPTLTRLPAATSPLVDQVVCDPTITVDQRGEARPQGARCEIGAVEIPPPPPESTTTTTAPPGTSGSTTPTTSPSAQATPPATLPVTGRTTGILVTVALVAIAAGAALAFRVRRA